MKPARRPRRAARRDPQRIAVVFEPALVDDPDAKERAIAVLAALLDDGEPRRVG